MDQGKRELSLYIHIPFCKEKCLYCDFLSFGGCGYTKQKQYMEALCKEISAYEYVAEQYEVVTIFIGGGTPSYVDASWIEQVLSLIRKVFDIREDVEITIEGNPDSLTKDKLFAYRRMGINRLSIGLQSANDERLRCLGRVHNYDQFIAAYNSARQAGFENINIDLMSGLPGEDTDSYVQTLGKVAQLQPEHISAYSLIVEEGTPLSQNEELLALLPSEEEDRRQYSRTKSFLKHAGYERYEISNYAKPGFSCRHNMVYWTGGEYLGMGLGASSCLKVQVGEKMETIRFHGVESMEEYIGRFNQCQGMMEDEYTELYHALEGEMEDMYEPDDLYDEMYGGMELLPGMDLSMGSEPLYGSESELARQHQQQYREYEQNVLLSFVRDYYRDLYFSKRKDQMEEFVFLGLRLMRGFSKEEFKKQFGTSVETIYQNVIDKYKDYGLLEEVEGNIRLTDAGIDVSNTVMAEFML